MLTAEAVVRTNQAHRHLAQLCRHADKMRDLSGSATAHMHGSGHRSPEIVSVECADGEGVLKFQAGRCVVRATGDTLTLRVEAADEHTLRRIQDSIGRRVETIASREGLKVSW